MNCGKASDQSVFEGYGAIADLPGKMTAALGGLIPSHDPDPQMAPDAIVDLINAEKGTRLLRAVVDPITGKYIQAVAEQFGPGLTLFGMGELLS